MLSGSSLAAPVGQITSSQLPRRAASRLGIAPGPDGNLWFAEIQLEGKIGEVNPATGAITEFATSHSTAAPLGIGLGPDGNIWFTESAIPGRSARSTQ